MLYLKDSYDDVRITGFLDFIHRLEYRTTREYDVSETESLLYSVGFHKSND
jgi:hypothetical protein